MNCGLCESPLKGFQTPIANCSTTIWTVCCKTYSRTASSGDAMRTTRQKELRLYYTLLKRSSANKFIALYKPVRLPYTWERRIVNCGIRDRSLIYTNSIILPLAVLCPKAIYSVYTFCGNIYDPVCEAWLFPLSDSGTAARLQELFTRRDDPLRKAFLTPLAVTLSGICYEKAETASFCKLLLTSAPEIVIMTTSDRLRGERR